jgi:hypothetical protein
MDDFNDLCAPTFRPSLVDASDFNGFISKQEKIEEVVAAGGFVVQLPEHWTAGHLEDLDQLKLEQLDYQNFKKIPESQSAHHFWVEEKDKEMPTVQVGILYNIIALTSLKI